MEKSHEIDQIIKTLKLEKHIENGYFRETYRSHLKHEDHDLWTVIYYLMTSRSRVTPWHKNKSDLMTFHHKGARLYFILIHEDGRLEERVISCNILEGE
jgi:uncharacterized protein